MFTDVYKKTSLNERDSKEFPWIREFEKAHKEIKQEIMNLRKDKGFQPYRGPAWSGGQKADDGVGYSSHKNGAWNVFYLHLHAMEFIKNVEKVPVLMGLLKKHLPRPFNHCFVSALTPGTHITPHYGPNNKKLRFHLPIMGCEGACLKVKDTIVELKEGACIFKVNLLGKGYVFDDSFLHEAWHKGSETRVILIADFWHPDLTNVEMKFLSFLMNVG